LGAGVRSLGLVALVGILTASTCLAGCVITPIVGGVITTLLTPALMPTRGYPAPQIIVVPAPEREQPQDDGEISTTLVVPVR
jgi:hypothetical protein